MYKIILIKLFTFCVIGCFSQGKLGISASVSNQGQVDKTLEDFYSLNFPYGFAIQEYTNKTVGSNLKYNLSLSCNIRDSINFRLRIGYASRSSSYEQDYPAMYWTKSDKHENIEICPSFGFTRNKGIFSFNAGIELPFYYIFDYTQFLNNKSYDTSMQLTHESEVNIKIDGGYIFGINNFLNVKLKLVKSLFLFSEVNFGLMYAYLGGKYERTITEIYPTSSDSYQTFDKTFTKLFFSPPQLQLGCIFEF